MVSCPGGRLCSEGSRKGDYSDISKVYYFRCKKTIDRLTKGVRLAFVEKATGLDVTTQLDSCLVGNFYV